MPARYPVSSSNSLAAQMLVSSLSESRFPAGKRDSLNEDTSICAARELEEETGYRAGKLEKLLSLKSTVAFCDELIDVYLATDLVEIGEQHLDEAEDIDIEAYELKELMDMCYSGTLQDAKTVAAIMAYAARK